MEAHSTTSRNRSDSGIAITILPPPDSDGISDSTPVFSRSAYRDTSPSSPLNSPMIPSLLEYGGYDQDVPEFYDYSYSSTSSTQSSPSSLLMSQFGGITLGDSVDYSQENTFLLTQQMQQHETIYGATAALPNDNVSPTAPRLIIPSSTSQDQLYGESSASEFDMSLFVNFDPDEQQQPSTSKESSSLLSPENYRSKNRYTSSEHISSPTSSWGSLSPDSESLHSPPAGGMSASVLPFEANTNSSGSFMGRPRGHSFGGVGKDVLAPSIRGRTHARNSSSPSPSVRRHSPYSRSPVSPRSPLPLASSDLLAVPQMPGLDTIQRRHSFSQARSPDLLSPTFCYHESAGEYAERQPAIRRVASMAGIKASEARRTKEARFQCDRCEQSFTTNHNLKNHQNVHLGIKPFQCPKCQRSSTTQSVHTRHMKTCKASSTPLP